MKLKSFKEFINEFEIEGEHQERKTGPFSQEDMREVQSIIDNYQVSLPVLKAHQIIADVEDDVNNNPDKYLDIDFGAYIESPKGLLSFYFEGFNVNPTEYKDMWIYEGANSLFAEIEGKGTNIFDSKFNNWMYIWSYDKIEDEKYYSSSDLNMVESGDFQYAIVFHSVSEFKKYMKDMENELSNKLPQFKKLVHDFVEQYCKK